MSDSRRVPAGGRVDVGDEARLPAIPVGVVGCLLGGAGNGTHDSGGSPLAGRCDRDCLDAGMGSDRLELVDDLFAFFGEQGHLEGSGAAGDWC